MRYGGCRNHLSTKRHSESKEAYIKGCKVVQGGAKVRDTGPRAEGIRSEADYHRLMTRVASTG